MWNLRCSCPVSIAGGFGSRDVLICFLCTTLGLGFIDGVFVSSLDRFSGVLYGSFGSHIEPCCDAVDSEACFCI